MVAILRSSGGEPYNESSPADLDGSVQETGKYWPLTDWLITQTVDSTTVAFAELEEVIGSPLPPSARNHLPYWYSVRNSLGKAIAAGGFKPSRVNLTSETVTLIRRQ